MYRSPYVVPVVVLSCIDSDINGGVMKKLFIIIFLFILGCETTPEKAGSVPADDTILRVGAFNIQIFGNTKVNRPGTLEVLARIASGFDVLAVEEVGSNNSSSTDETCAAIMDKYVEKINEVYGEGVFAYVRGNQYAIVYRSDRVRVNSHALYTGTCEFTYTPLVANLTAIAGGANLDFSMVVIHTSPSKAVTEIPALKTVIDEVRALYLEPDVICAGDFNADGSYYDEGDDQWLAGFDLSSYITAIPNLCDTTVAASANTYDRIQMTMSMSGDYTNDSGVVRFGEVYDLSGCEGTETTAGTEEAVSDHYPVWCALYTDRDED